MKQIELAINQTGNGDPPPKKNPVPDPLRQPAPAPTDDFGSTEVLKRPKK